MTTTPVSETTPIIAKDFYVVRLTSKSGEGKNEYLTEQHFIGYRFTEDFATDVVKVIHEFMNNQKASDMRGTDAICRFDTKEEAEALLVKIFNQHYKKNKHELAGHDIEIVRVIMAVDEQVICKVTPDDVLGLSKDAESTMIEFEGYLISTKYGKDHNIDEQWLKNSRKNNLCGYKDKKVDDFFQSWRELNGK